MHPKYILPSSAIMAAGVFAHPVPKTTLNLNGADIPNDPFIKEVLAAVNKVENENLDLNRADSFDDQSIRANTFNELNRADLFDDEDETAIEAATIKTLSRDAVIRDFIKNLKEAKAAGKLLDKRESNDAYFEDSDDEDENDDPSTAREKKHSLKKRCIAAACIGAVARGVANVVYTIAPKVTGVPFTS